MVVRIGQNRERPARPVYFRHWREDAGLTQEELAERLDTTKSAISKLEHGHSKANQVTLEAFAAVIGCEPEDPLKWSPEQKRALKPANPETTSGSEAIAAKALSEAAALGPDGPAQLVEALLRTARGGSAQPESAPRRPARAPGRHKAPRAGRKENPKSK